jgi:hypothetical protein
MRDPWTRRDRFEAALSMALRVLLVVVAAFVTAYGVAMCGSELAIDRPGAETE